MRINIILKFCLLFRATQTPARGQALDLLPTIGASKPEIFIKSIDDKAISWSAFLHPFSHDMWIMLFFEIEIQQGNGSKCIGSRPECRC